MRRKRFFLFVVTAIMALLVKADDFMVDGIYYKMINDEEIAVISHPAYLSYEGEIVIPENISGYNVTRISESAFFGCNKLTSIELPNTIQRIETGAFYNCSKLKKMNVPEDLYYIGDVAFMFDTLLIDFSIPETVTHIGERAFAYCMSMTSVKIPESVTFIGEYPFNGCI